MRYTADLVLLPDGKLHTEITVSVEPDGAITGVDQGIGDNVHVVSGILIPGFINSHCHLELSHLRGLIDSGKGLQAFVGDVVSSRKAGVQNIQSAIRNADVQMWERGIQAVGDICNSMDGMECKSQSKIRYHNLVEVFGLASNLVSARVEDAKTIIKNSISMNMEASIVPHAPYSVCPELFKSISACHSVMNGIWSIHHCESLSEKTFVSTGTGAFRTMFEKMGLMDESFSGFGKSATEYIANHFPSQGKILLVHNTYMDQNDVRFLKSTGRFDDIYFCLCPNANLYIEGRLPDIPMMSSEGCKLVIGTDSLASNHSLSIWDEIAAIRSVFPEISLEQTLQWATTDAAQLFGWNDLGQIAIGKKPGLVAICGNHVSRLV